MVISEHGGNIYNHDILYDFSSNLNPLGMPQTVKNVLINSVDKWEKYPDPFCRRLTEKLAEKEKFPVEKIICGNGAADLIYRIVQAVKPQNSVVCAPSFGEYEKALLQSGSKITKHYLSEENGFVLDESILKIFDENIDMIFLCTPNNPTGRTIDGSVLSKIAEKCLTQNIICVCDECFLDFVKNGTSIRNFINEKIIILKAFTKIYAMAGLRLGYAIFDDTELAANVQRTGQFWSVSAPAQAAGEAALDESDYFEKTFEIIEKEREYLSESLSQFGFKVYNSDANFILFRCNIPIDEMLLKEKILIRNCGNYDGLSNEFFRVAVRGHEKNTALISAIRRVIDG